MRQAAVELGRGGDRGTALLSDLRCLRDVFVSDFYQVVKLEREVGPVNPRITGKSNHLAFRQVRA
ncbi:hypothetical protein SAMN05216499_102507 [Actinacidiphila paucisporea]|uniref:Uncharacterized protein n=1 Tax=Actinacidiphila paucisporea TaxID=310782 RepID=A0A1M6XRZ1_9ACTN|nr:hypothetical protein SAMN05216499_102507 [Actinacidiphila paucisporea]